MLLRSWAYGATNDNLLMRVSSHVGAKNFREYFLVSPRVSTRVMRDEMACRRGKSADRIIVTP